MDQYTLIRTLRSANQRLLDRLRVSKDFGKNPFVQSS